MGVTTSGGKVPRGSALKEVVEARIRRNSRQSRAHPCRKEVCPHIDA